MELKQGCKYALLCPSSMGVRITPLERQPVHTSSLFQMQATSAETNVLSVPAALGLKTKALTKFVEGSPVAELIRRDLRMRGIDYEGVSVPQGGPWGYRHQFNIADSGFGVRGPRVWNDRAGEVGCSMSAADFDLEHIFGTDGAQIVHLSGLIAAMSPETGELCLEIARAARKYNTKVSFDLNYRDSFWKGREKELSDIFGEIASLSNILIGNEEDFQLCLGIKGPEAGGKDVFSKLAAFKEMTERVIESYPNASTYATTLRQVVNANEHLWGAIMYSEGKWFEEAPRKIPVLDRIGGGDGFVGGLLYSALKGWEPEKWIKFAWATGALAASMTTDYAHPADEAQVWSIYEGNARVMR